MNLAPQLPDYGCFLRWPEDGHSFIHPDDVVIANRCIPSARVFRRDSFDGVYYHFSYGQIRMRLRPCMWLKVTTDGLDVGDKVETIGVGMERDQFVAEVLGMYYVTRKGCILYRLRRGDSIIPQLFASTHLRLLTDKSTIRPGEIGHPSPRWHGKGDTIEGVDLS